MANPGNLPIADVPVQYRLELLRIVPDPVVVIHRITYSNYIDIRAEASMGGDSTVLCNDNAAREGKPTHATMNMMYQANVQQNLQRNEFTLR